MHLREVCPMQKYIYIYFLIVAVNGVIIITQQRPRYCRNEPARYAIRRIPPQAPSPFGVKQCVLEKRITEQYIFPKNYIFFFFTCPRG